MKKTAGLFTAGIIAIIFYLSFSGLSAGSVSKKENLFIPSDTLSVSSPLPKNFLNVIYSFGYGSVQENISKYKSTLNYSGVQVFYTNQDSLLFGGFGSILNQNQINNVTDLTNSVSAIELPGIFERVNISELCMAQRVVYEVPERINDNNTNDGFCYTGRDANSCEYIDEDTDINGVKSYGVLKCIKGKNKPGFIAKGIYENIQHSDIFDWQWSDAGRWYLVPKMRIKKSDFALMPDTLAAAIVVYNFNKNRIDSILIRVKNFEEASGGYSGNYTERYKSEIENYFQIKGGKNSGELNEKNEGWNKDDCGVDFKVYWFGKVDLWFDCMTVENETAHRLFNNEYDACIDDEMANYKNNKWKIYSFYTDELTYSNIPCVKYVTERMKKTAPDAVLSCAMTNYNNIRGLRKYSMIGIKKFLEEVNPKLFTVDAHEILYGNFLPAEYIKLQQGVDAHLNDEWLRSNKEYTDYFQNKVLGDRHDIKSRTDYKTYIEAWPHSELLPSTQGTLIYQVSNIKKLKDEIAPDARMIVQPQLHSYAEDKPQESGYKYPVNNTREPLNEEIEAQAMVCIAHGADGLGWFVYNSPAWNSSNTFNTHHGLTKPGTNIERDINMYGQNKWDYISAMNKRISGWKPILDKLIWREAYSVQSEGAGHNYIDDIKSLYRPDIKKEFIGEDAIKYWEIGFFDTGISDDKSKYVFIVNRRTIPNGQNYDGDNRKLMIKFNFGHLNDAVKWNIIDEGTQKIVSTINASQDIFFDMGIFLPGEGKLYKIQPIE